MRHWAEGLVARYARLTFAQLESGCWLGTESFEAFRENGLQPFGYICRSLRQNLPLSGGNLRCWQGPKSKKVAWRLCDMSHMLKLPIDLHQQHSLSRLLFCQAWTLHLHSRFVQFGHTLARTSLLCSLFAGMHGRGRAFGSGRAMICLLLAASRGCVLLRQDQMQLLSEFATGCMQCRTRIKRLTPQCRKLHPQSFAIVDHVDLPWILYCKLAQCS